MAADPKCTFCSQPLPVQPAAPAFGAIARPNVRRDGEA
jgi:hypothetical protein